MTRQVAPVPSVAAGAGPFRIEHCDVSEGGCSATPSADTPGLFVAPLADLAPSSVGIRQHEYGHLALLWRGVVPHDTLVRLARDGIHDVWVQGALDVVVNAYMLARGNREIAELRPWRGEPPSRRWLAAVTFLRCEGMTVTRAELDRVAHAGALTGTDLRVLAGAGRVLRRMGLQERRIGVHELARLLTTLQERFGPDPDERIVEMATSTRGRGRRAGPDALEAVAPGAMEIVHLALPEVAQPARLASRHYAGRIGAFRYPHRALLPGADGRAFGARRKVHGGTMLVDCSGSMKVDATDIQRLLKGAPALTVALYASLPKSLDRGRLLVVAKQGRIAHLSRLSQWFGPGNVVDIPALEWLRRQSCPRVWVSDGLVTGVGDTLTKPLVARAEALVRAGHIRQVKSLGDLLKDPP